MIDKPGKGAFFETDLELTLRNCGIENLIVCGVTTEVCVNTTVREANDRGYRCIVLGDCCASYFPEFHEMGLKMIKAQGGIFGWVSDSKTMLAALARAPKRAKTRLRQGGSHGSSDDVQTSPVDARRLERVLRLRHQHPGQHAHADRRCCASC